MSHLHILKVLNWIFATLNIAVGSCLGGWGLFMIGGVSQDPTEAGVSFTLIYILAALFAIAVSVMYGACAVGVEDGRRRMLQTILAVLSLPSIPLGTAYGIYALWVCHFNEETKQIFDEHQAILEEADM